MDADDENISTLMAMGFPDINEITRALRLAKNDLNEAVAILTNDQPPPLYGSDFGVDVDMKDSSQKDSKDENTGSDTVDNDDYEHFPETHLYELESRVFTDQWSIPYKKDESFHKCLVAAAKMIEAGKQDGDINLNRFMNRCMPEAFKKLLNSGAVQRWNAEIQKGIYNMLELFIDLLIVCLKQKPAPVDLLTNIFAVACDLDCEWNNKNRSQLSEEHHWEDIFGPGEVFARSPESLTKDPHGWLVDLLNHFGAKNGFGLVQEIFEEEELGAATMAALLKPFGNCAELLNKSIVLPLLSKCIERSVNYVKSIKDGDLKNKDIGAVLDLLVSLKLLCHHIWPEQGNQMNEMRLEMILRMLKTPNFSVRMNALKEVVKMVEEAESLNTKKSSTIPSDYLAEWMSHHKVLSVALEGNIDHAQYTDRIKGLVEFLSPRLTCEELSQIWTMVDKNFHVVDNVHGVLAAATSKLGVKQFDHLLLLVKEKWQHNSNERTKEKLLTFLGQMGKESRMLKTGSKILEALWESARCPGISSNLVERAMDEHLSVLLEMSNRDQLRKSYVLRCIDDLKKGKQGTFPVLRYLHNLARSIIKGSGGYYKPDKAALAEWNNSHDIVKLLVVSLERCHTSAAAAARGSNQTLSHSTVVEKSYGYNHGQLMIAHLELLQLLLKEADLYLPWARCKELWDTLVSNTDACEADRESCYEWFTSCLGDMQPDTQSTLFKEKILKSNPAQLSAKGFECVKAFFESVNVSEGKIRRFGSQVVIEKLDPIGTDFFWQIALESLNENLAKQAMDNILNVSYLWLTPRLKKDPVSLHKRFIAECYKKLESQVPFCKTSASNTPMVAINELLSLSHDKKLTCIQHVVRILEIVEIYIRTIEENFQSQRLIRPHGLSFKGEPVMLHIRAEESKTEIDLIAHNRETVFEVKQHIANVLRLQPDQIVLFLGSTSLAGREQRSLSQLDCLENSVLIVKSASGLATVASGAQLTELKENWDELPNATSPTAGSFPDDEEPNKSIFSEDSQSGASAARITYNSEQEKSLPGIIMANGGQVFSMLFQLSEIQDIKVQKVIRNLLHLMPTDPAVIEVLDKITLGRSAASAFPSAAGFDAEPNVRFSGFGSNVPISPVKSKFGSMTKPSAKSDEGWSPIMSRSPRTMASLKSNAEKESVEEMLKTLFSSSAPNSSPFRVLYNLEALSAKLVPTNAEIANAVNSNRFKQEFLVAGGLHYICGILRKDYFSAGVSTEVRQGCCHIALQLARFLLCGEVEEGDLLLKPSVTPVKQAPAKTIASKISPIRITTPVKIQASPSKPTTLTATTLAASPLKTKPAKAAIQVLQTLGEDQFSDMIASFVRVCWAAAAGKLDLASAASSKESVHELFSSGPSSWSGRGRHHGSSNNNTSNADICGLSFGICGPQSPPSQKDILIACEALELLVICLEIRGTKDLKVFFSLPYIKDFIIDILLGCASAEIREKASSLLFRLSQSPDQASKTFLAQVLVKTPVPLWIPSCTTRGTSQRLLSQCSQYFNLRHQLLSSLSTSDQQTLAISASSMLNDEIAWLSNFSPFNGNPSPEMESADNALLAGHVNVVRGLLSCEGVDKREAGKRLVPDLLNSFLFPASKLIQEGSEHSVSASSSVNYNPKCSQPESRFAAYSLITSLVTSCPENLKDVVKKLISMHHRYNPDLAKEFEYEPAIDGRSICNYVGLKNAGATCYMNSVIQQLFLIPGIKESVLSIDEEDSSEDTLFFQLQMVFGHLLDSRLQYYAPEKFWKCLRLRGQPVNVREQQDSFEFFTHLVDSIDEYLLKMGREKIFQNSLGGVFSDQMICKECPHRYEREQIFLALNLTVKSHHLLDSLEQFVKGELLEGDNAYFCEECGVKRSTVKRMCIKSLPSTLVIQLKRFDYDWDAGRSLKFDDYFQFPWTLDMTPYTADGITERESMESAEGNSAFAKRTTSTSSPTNYELVGVVVHSGQANAGHYYSFIKERCKNGDRTRWLKFNDTTVEEFDMNDATLEAECFGGTYKAKVHDNTNGFPETRQRYWNGYILFYDRVEEPTKNPRTPRKNGNFNVGGGIVTRSRSYRGAGSLTNTPNKFSSSSIGHMTQRDSLTQLSELLNHGERQGLFGAKMPARVQQAIREENLRFMKSRDVFCPDYYEFVFNLCSANKGATNKDCVLPSLNLAINFLCHTYLRVRAKESDRLNEWVELIGQYTDTDAESANWMINYWANEDNTKHIRSFLLECPTRMVRQHFCKLLENSMTSYFKHGGQTTTPSINKILEFLLAMLDKDVPDNCKTSSQYFQLLSVYSKMGTMQSRHLFHLGLFNSLLVFLFGPEKATNSGHQEGATSPFQATSSLPRRWSRTQTKDFQDLHTTIANLVLNYGDGDSLRSSPPPEITTLFSSNPHYVQELIPACGHLSAVDNSSPVVRMLVYVCKDNLALSRSILKEILVQCEVISASELKNFTQLIQEILALEDSLQFERMQSVIDGVADSDDRKVEGLLALIQSLHSNDSRRAYQLMKFLVSLANRIQVVKNYLLQSPAKWQWSVQWLKQKIEQSYWSPHSEQSNEDSNTRVFQRTTSAQVTLEEATALLTEFESSDMETDTDVDFGMAETPGDDKDTTDPLKPNCQFSLGS